MRNLISSKDLTKKDIEALFRLTDKLKKSKTKPLSGKTLMLFFEKPSTRTVVSFATAMIQLGGGYIYLTPREMQISRGETIRDTAKVLSRYVDGIAARTFKHTTVTSLAEHADIPVINALTDLEHPCQALADLYTIKKKKGLKGKIVFLGDGSNNTFHSLIQLCEKFNFEIIVSCPAKYKPKIKGKYKVVTNPREAIKGADIVYTDVWVSMGQEKQAKQRLKDLSKYQLNPGLLKLAPRAIVMHPLPAHRGQEITSPVLDGKQSVVLDQAENRLHTQKAVLCALMK